MQVPEIHCKSLLSYTVATARPAHLAARVIQWWTFYTPAACMLLKPGTRLSLMHVFKT
jgi:hypothetical protein